MKICTNCVHVRYESNVAFCYRPIGVKSLVDGKDPGIGEACVTERSGVRCCGAEGKYYRRDVGPEIMKTVVVGIIGLFAGIVLAIGLS